MLDKDAIQMMRRCSEEIRQLRRINSELAPKADAYDSLRQVLNLIPQPTQGYGEDLVYRLEKEIEEIENQCMDQAMPDNESD